MIFAIMCALIFTPQAVYATGSTLGGEQPKKIEPISSNNNVLEESVEASKGWIAGKKLKTILFKSTLLIYRVLHAFYTL